jgi:hypothetical protein
VTASDKAITCLAAYAIPTIVLGIWLNVWSVLVGVIAGTVITVSLALAFARRRP